MLLHNAASDGQAQTRATLFPPVRSINLLKAFEDAFPLFLWNAPSLVLYLKQNLIRLRCRT